VLEVTAPHRAAYPWQQDAFHLGVVVPPPPSPAASSSPDEEPPHLHGVVRVAEALEDEWFVVWLLRLATAHPALAAKGLTARVADVDGDFLLIEAAAACPHAWLESPEAGAHRAWIRGGQARFIAEDLCPPCEYFRSKSIAARHCCTTNFTPSIHSSIATTQRHTNTTQHQHKTAKPLPLRGALELLRTHPPAATSAPWLDAAIADRVQGYPARIAAETHHVACYLPAAAAALLTAQPRLIAAAVRALGSREPGELVALSKGSDAGTGGSDSSSGSGSSSGGWRFPPSPLVPVRLPFAQRAFGQLRHEEAQPPKAFLGPIAEALAREGAARSKGQQHQQQQHQQQQQQHQQQQQQQQQRVQAAVERGVRLACGLEMLYRRSRRRRQRQGHPGPAALSAASSWQAYLGRLQARGFFDGVIEGSADHRERVASAREAFERRERQAAAQRVARPVPEPPQPEQQQQQQQLPVVMGDRLFHEWVDEALAAMDPAMLTQQGAFPASLGALPPDDDEGWLEIEPSQLEGLLERYGQSAQGEEDGLDSDGGGEEEDEEEEEEEEGSEAGDADVEALLEGMKGFLGAMGGLEGAEMAEAPSSSGSSGDPVSFDVGRLLSILRGDDVKEALRGAGVGLGSDGGSDDDDEEEAGAWPMMVDARQERPERQERPGGEGEGEEEEEEEDWRRGFRMREIPRGGNSDVDSDDGPAEADTAAGMAEEEEEEGGAAMEMEAYMAQLDQELRGTTLDASFERTPPTTAAVPARSVTAGATADDGDEVAAAGAAGVGELPPVDLDLNLVRHLLDSMASQGAAPGPASNLLGEIFEQQQRRRK
jgi:hypothetical protein